MSSAVLGQVQRLTRRQRLRLLRRLSPEATLAWNADWLEWAQAEQLEPGGDWRNWVLMAGRGFGKTRAGAEWVSALARAHGGASIALVAATVDEARRVMVEGPSGLLAVARPGEPVRFVPSRRRLVFASGAEAVLFSGANPEGLRGPQHHFAWCDELAKWRHPGETWAMLQLGLRAGARPRALATTTPRAGLAALKAILAAADTVATGGPAWANPGMSNAWVKAMDLALGTDTRRARQEVEGELIADVEGSLWPAELIEASRGVRPEAMRRVMVGVDPPASAAGTCGIVACGVDAEGIGWVLGDHSRAGLSPEGWAHAVADAAEAHGADRVVVETNQGGEMVEAVLRSADRAMPVRPVTAREGKAARAEPVAALFEAGRVKLAGAFRELEAELGAMTAGQGYAGPGRSPDRADAMVWALTELMPGRRAMPSVRPL